MGGLGERLAAVLKGLGQGTQHQYNQETLGPDYAERLAKVKLALEAGRLANKETGLDIGAKQRGADEADLARQSELTAAQETTYPVGPGEDPSDVTVTPQGPQDHNALIARFRAMKAAEDRGLTTRKTESEIVENEANAVNLASKPDVALQQLDIRRQALEAQMARAQDSNERAALGRELQLMKIQQSHLEFQQREGRLENQFKSRTQVDQGTRFRLGDMSSARKQLQSLRNLLQDPEVKQYLGPVMGRLTVAQMTKGGGVFTSPKQREVMIRVAQAFNTAANAFGGKVLPPNEVERVAKAFVYENDTLDQMDQKAQLALDVYDDNIERTVLSLGPEGQNQQRPMLEHEGFDTGFIPPDVDAAVPARSPGKPVSVVPGGPNAPAPGGGGGGAKLYKYQGRQVSFEQLPPAVQAKVRARGL